MELVIYSGLIGLLLGLCTTIIAGAAGYTLGRKRERQEIAWEKILPTEPRTLRLLREYEQQDNFEEVRRVPRCRTHSGSAMACLAMVLAASCAWPKQTSAGQACVSDLVRDRVLKGLHGEVLVGNAPGTAGGGTIPIVVELWLGKTSMTVIIVRPDDPAPNCIVAAAREWRWVKPTVPELESVRETPLEDMP